MTPDYITAQTKAGESETPEFKEATGTRREVARTACAFLNQGGGQVLFQVSPTGVIVGEQVSKRAIEELGAGPRRVDPPAIPAVERVPLHCGHEVIVVRNGRGNQATESRLIRPYSLTRSLSGENGETP